MQEQHGRKIEKLVTNVKQIFNDINTDEKII